MYLYLLYPCELGFGLFSYKIGKIPLTIQELRHLINDVEGFVNTVELVDFKKFDTDAGKQMEAFLQGQMTIELQKFLLLNLPKVKVGKKDNFSLGVANPELGYNIYDATNIPFQSSDFVLEVLRGVGLHFDRYMEKIENLDNEGGNKDVEETPLKRKAKKKFSELEVENTPMASSTKKRKKKIL